MDITASWLCKPEWREQKKNATKTISDSCFRENVQNYNTTIRKNQREAPRVCMLWKYSFWIILYFACSLSLAICCDMYAVWMWCSAWFLNKRIKTLKIILTVFIYSRAWPSFVSLTVLQYPTTLRMKLEERQKRCKPKAHSAMISKIPMICLKKTQ